MKGPVSVDVSNVDVLVVRLQVPLPKAKTRKKKPLVWFAL